MKIISHRGFIDGTDKNLENNPEQILNLVNKGIDVEIDIRIHNNKFYLGHDEPMYEVTRNFIENEKLWCHAKTFSALQSLSKINCHYFWHQNDDYTLTSRGFIWVYPGKPILDNSICVTPENFNLDYSKCFGICTDHVKKYIKDLK